MTALKANTGLDIVMLQSKLTSSVSGLGDD